MYRILHCIKLELNYLQRLTGIFKETYEPNYQGTTKDKALLDKNL